ncbi:MAG TPA: ECF transporter S component [Candidatus Portnoybacteria bacterium]|nr:ECF transporter S component [Candidatus Portnoybacteria bacterium]
MTNLQVLQLTKTKTLFFAAVFTALSVATPMAAHYFGGPLAGRLFLPMHFFVLSAGLLLGWRAGLAVGVLTPLIAYSVSVMPLAAVLPFIIIEVAAYGFFAGLLQERFKNIWVSLVGAMVLGRLFLWLGIAILPTKLIASQYLVGTLQAGWRGIALQILLVPIAVIFIQKFLRDERI